MKKVIVLEGLDGCGKDTQIELLKKTHEFCLFQYPTSNFPLLREYLDGKAHLHPKSVFLLFLSDIANEQEKVASVEGLAVLNRYVHSTISYQLKGVGYEEAKAVVSEMGYIEPDLVILLDIPPEVAARRKAKQKTPDRYESDVEYLRGVRGRFLKLASEGFLAKKWAVVDASKPVEEVHAEIFSLLEK